MSENLMIYLFALQCAQNLNILFFYMHIISNIVSLTLCHDQLYIIKFRSQKTYFTYINLF